MADPRLRARKRILASEVKMMLAPRDPCATRGSQPVRRAIMSRTGFAAVVVLVTAVTAASTREPTFSRVETYPDMGRLDYILAVADFNNDGRDDILAGGREEAALDGPPEVRHDTTALEVFFGQEDGSFEHAPDLIDGTIEARLPIVVAADFNNDEQIDFAVFDAGVYVGEESVGYGNPPRAHSRFPGHALTPTGVMAIRCKQFHLPDL